MDDIDKASIRYACLYLYFIYESLEKRDSLVCCTKDPMTHYPKLLERV